MGPVSPWRPKAARRRQRLRAREGQRGSAWRRSGSLHQSRRCWSTCKARYLSLRLRHCLAIRSKAHRMVVFTTSGQAHPAATRMASRLHITCSACSSTPSPTSFMVCDASGRHPGEQRCVGEQSSPVGEGRWSQRHRASPCTSPPEQKGGDTSPRLCTAASQTCARLRVGAHGCRRLVGAHYLLLPSSGCRVLKEVRRAQQAAPAQQERRACSRGHGRGARQVTRQQAAARRAEVLDGKQRSRGEQHPPGVEVCTPTVRLYDFRVRVRVRRNSGPWTGHFERNILTTAGGVPSSRTCRTRQSSQPLRLLILRLSRELLSPRACSGYAAWSLHGSGGRSAR